MVAGDRRRLQTVRFAKGNVPMLILSSRAVWSRGGSPIDCVSTWRSCGRASYHHHHQSPAIVKPPKKARDEGARLVRAEIEGLSGSQYFIEGHFRQQQDERNPGRKVLGRTIGRTASPERNLSKPSLISRSSNTAPQFDPPGKRPAGTAYIGDVALQTGDPNVTLWWLQFLGHQATGAITSIYLAGAGKPAICSRSATDGLTA